MKAEAPSPDSVLALGNSRLISLLLVLALVAWAGQDFFSSLAASETTITAQLRTTTEPDDARLLRAFEQVRRGTPAEVTLVTEPSPKEETRDARLTITAHSKKEAAADLDSMVRAIQAAFAKDASSDLFLIDQTRPSPVSNATTVLIRRSCRWATFAFLFGVFALVLSGLNRQKVPTKYVWWFAAAVGAAVLIVVGTTESAAVGPAVLLSVVPLLVFGRVAFLVRRVRTTGAWAEGLAQITKSELAVTYRDDINKTTVVSNVARVDYRFVAGGRTIDGDRITAGSGLTEDPNITLKRYPVGARVAVFYDAAHPDDCALERDPASSRRSNWEGAAAVLLVYGVAALAFWKWAVVGVFAAKALPQVHHPVVVIIAGLLGLLCLGSFVWNSRHPRQAVPWLKTTGRIVDNAADPSNVEFSYVVDGREYHNGVPKEEAGDAVAGYPVGGQLDVYYDPERPDHSGLQVDTDMMLTGRSSLVVAIVLIAVATYAALR